MQDPVAYFFNSGTRELSSPPRADHMQLELKATIEDTLAAPLALMEGQANGLDGANKEHGGLPQPPPDGALPSRMWLLVMAYRALRPGVITAVQVGVGTQQVLQLQLGEDGSRHAASSTTLLRLSLPQKK